MQKIFWVYLVIIVVGILFLVLPENGKRIVVINENHGPPATDAVGLALIIVCWTLMQATAIKNRKKVRNIISEKWVLACITVIVLGSAWTIISLTYNALHEWIPGALLAIAAYSIVFVAAFKK